MTCVIDTLVLDELRQPSFGFRARELVDASDLSLYVLPFCSGPAHRPDSGRYTASLLCIQNHVVRICETLISCLVDSAP